MKDKDNIQRELEQYKEHCIEAFRVSAININASAFTPIRKSAEAVAKIIILDKYGNLKAMNYFLGKVDLSGKTINKEPMLNDFIYELRQGHLTQYSIINLLSVIQNNTNPESHDPNKPMEIDEISHSLRLCMEASYHLTIFIYKELKQDVPDELIALHNQKYQSYVLDSVEAKEGERLREYVCDFSEGTKKYVLIAPDNYGKCTENQLSILSNIHWSFVLDLNHNSQKAGGLYSSFMPNIEKKCVPITIKQESQHNIVSQGNDALVNWFFVKGLEVFPQTVVHSLSEWNLKNYSRFTKKLFSEFFSNSLMEVVFVCLSDDYKLVSRIFQKLEDVDEVNAENVKICVVNSNDSVRDNFQDSIESLGYEMESFNLNLPAFLRLLSDFVVRYESTITQKIVPATQDKQKSVIDISDKYHYFEDAGLFIVHQNIAGSVSTDNKIPPFYLGNTITWSELAEDVDVKRSQYDSISGKLRKLLDSSTKSLKFNLYYNPGAGGTTISRRIAYDLRKIYPTVLLQKISEKTVTLIGQLHGIVKSTILCVVDYSIVNKNALDDLIKECNVKKWVVVFVCLERITNRKRNVVDLQMRGFVKAKMENLDEAKRFFRKTVDYSSSQLKSEEWLYDKDVLDYILAICEKDYSPERLESYVDSYIKVLDEPLNQFVANVSLIYYYSQKPVSELLFKSLFERDGSRISLVQYLKSRPDESAALNKLLIQRKDENGSLTDNWVPRYQRFAECAVHCLLGGSNRNNWKSQLPEYSKNLISIIKQNNEYLVDDTREILKSVFLERGREDRIGMEEDWQSATSNEKFSQLLEDVADSNEQRNILMLLADSFPSESHFWAHLARFCYEKADCPKQFEEAMSYVLKAFEAHGEGDFNLQHIAGMCQRRLIEYYLRNNIPLENRQIISITEKARGYFAVSRELNSKNIHAYISDIQLITIVIELAKKQSSISSYRNFLLSVGNEWYQELYCSMNDLIDEANILIDQLGTLGKTNKLQKSRSFLNIGQTNSLKFAGNDNESLAFVRSRLESMPQNERPRMRLLYVRMLLLIKAHGQYDDIHNSWKKLTPNEIELVDKYLTKNILQDVSNASSIRYWFMLVRYADSDVLSIDEVISRLKMLHSRSGASPMVQLEAAYYLYIMNAFKLIQDGDALNKKMIEETGKWIDECKRLSPNDKATYEWLGDTKNFKSILNGKFRGDVELCRMTGVISSIKSETQGEIILPCGLTCFFAPSYSKIYKGQDETKEVYFQIGFRHDGLWAINVQKTSEEGCANELLPVDEVIEQETKEFDIEAIELDEDKTFVQPEQSEIFETERPDKPKVNIIGKIPLDKLGEPNKKRFK